MARLKRESLKTKIVTNNNTFIIDNRIKIYLNCEVTLIIRKTKMVQCSIANCKSSCRSGYEGGKMVFFKVPSKPQTVLHKGSKREHREKSSAIKQCQHDAWMLAVNRGYQDQHFKEADNGNVRICIHHFHPSVITMDENGKHRLKPGAAPTLYLTPFSM